MLSRWVLTVASLMYSLAAACRLVFPAATSSRTSSSRWLSGPGSGLPAPGAPNPLLSPAATEGRGTASPPAAAGRGGAGRLLERVAGRPRLDRGQHVAVGVVGGQHQHARGAASPA